MESKKRSRDSGGEGAKPKRRVGLIYDERMCKHFNTEDDTHPETPNRILAVWKKLQSAGITRRCVIMNGEEVEDKYAALVHSKKHVKFVKGISSKKFDSSRISIAREFESIYFNKGSTEAAFLAAGSVIEVAEKVAKGDLDSAFAVVRPPGHHAEVDEPMGFCLFNNVAIATSFLLNERPELGIKKILIVDWDVHHGNGTQKMFYDDPRVLFFSVHRHEYESFYPTGDDGSYIMVGEGPGTGYNINVPWQDGPCGDADYLAAWEHVLLPVAKEFNPDMVIVSAGFDAAINDPLGGCRVTPYGFAIMLKQLMEFANGKIVMALEGGYNLDSLANSVLSCVQVLLNEVPLTTCSEAYPFESTWRVIQLVREELSTFWPTLAKKLPKSLPSQKNPEPDFSLEKDGARCLALVKKCLRKDLLEECARMSERERLEAVAFCHVQMNSLLNGFQVKSDDLEKRHKKLKQRFKAAWDELKAAKEEAGLLRTQLISSQDSVQQSKEEARIAQESARLAREETEVLKGEVRQARAELASVRERALQFVKDVIHPAT